MNNLLIFLNGIQKQGLEIKTVYDIGANQGNWSTIVQKFGCPNANFIMFEANINNAELLKQTKIPFIISVLSSPEKKYVDFYNQNSTGDSYYKENSKYYENEIPIRMPCVTLDELIERHNLPIPNLIKLDTQGSELDILKGAKSILDEVALIYTECPILNYNQGSPNFQQYLDFFKENKFVPVGIFGVHPVENMLMQVDMMFVRYDIKQRYLGKSVNYNPFA